MDELIKRVRKTIDDFYNAKKECTDEELKLARNYLEWIITKTDIILNEKRFVIPKGFEDKVKWGSVFWIYYGYNIDHEFGGKHPALILKASPNMVIVAPLSSQQPTDVQKRLGIYVEVEDVVGFGQLEGNKSRWINLLDVKSVSIQRIDFDSRYGHVKGYILDRVNEGMNNLWKAPKY